MDEKKEKEIMTAEQLLVTEYLEMKKELKDLRERNDCLGESARYLLKRNVELKKAIDCLDIRRGEGGFIEVGNTFLLKRDKGFDFFNDYLRQKEDEEKTRKGTEKLLKAIFKEDEAGEENEEKKENE